ncbi:Coenzyme F420 hydrogenase/dehydrogenase, beta subunit C-terminal domain [Aquimarina sp. ERC-38]|uniref:Coenzyme F420 hydrogenase/dehydrogenase, beta subunit C-terminal domain n=1 Tax=Aquimarina sp. ERC-38 TaxID=2949996 RepID=UPI002246A11D|nr:Coenzyme F420 hydrogenase/dehydrogenase, beta subunit C-terminal domain [Aquimarina sp. ERC-38]UZO81872.1 Coenzyme F420 hydrogenase/dehydrogenase, beta subunit C-terminal domain [Aquimarina sp. ERC-38]
MEIEKMVLKDNLCAGCGLCESVFETKKISISFDDKGFLRPTFHDKLSLKEQDRFKNICPGIKAEHPNIDHYSTLWGPYLHMTSGFAKNPEVRYSGSSGGVLTALGSYLLDSKKVECLLHIGASEELPYLNEPKISYSSNEVQKNTGSRYAPSATLQQIKRAIENHNSIGIIGKPCDILGVRNYMKVDEVANKKIKYLLSFMCAGVPSQKGTDHIINNFKLKKENVVSLKYRGEGWPGYFKIVDKEDRTHKITYNESWGTVLNRYLQFRCKICADGTGEFADITCADAWESSENGYPSFEEKEGKSLIIIRNKNGAELIEQAQSANYLVVEDKIITEEQLGKMQPYQKSRKQNILSRILALYLFKKSVPIYNKNLLLKAAFKENPIYLFKNFLGMINRLWRLK